MENEELVKLYQQGSKNALENILEQNRGIVLKMANKFYIAKSNSIDEEDLIQEGYIGLMIAAQRYDFYNPNKAKFITYAIHWIYSKMNRFIRQKNTNEETSLNIPITDKNIELADTIQDKSFDYKKIEECIYYQDIRKELDKVMDRSLTLKEKTTIKLSFGWDGQYMSLDEIAAMYENEDKQCIIVTKNRALGKIRRTSWARKEWISRREEYSYKYY